MKYLLILGGSTDQVFMIKTAQNMGIGTVVLDGNRYAPGLGIANISANIDFSSIEKVILYVTRLMDKGFNICGVNTMGSDVPHIISAIASHFQWEGPTSRTARIATDKYLMKQCLHEAGFNLPKYALVDTYMAIEPLWSDWNCDRIIIKPTDRSGSRGVRVIDSFDKIKSSFQNALEKSYCGKVIMEEYITGPQISTESIIFGNKTETPGFADRVYDTTMQFAPNIIENGGWVPSAISQELMMSTKQVVEQAALALGVTKGIIKGDIVIDEKRGPLIIEIAARLSGGDFSESLVPLSSGINYVEQAIRICIGEEPIWEELEPKFNKVVANRYFFLPSGILDGIEGYDEARCLSEVSKIVVHFKAGDSIPLLESHANRAGVFIVKASSRDEAQKVINNVYQLLKFKINGKWVSGDPRIKHLGK
jgi:biotin carboxylase